MKGSAHPQMARTCIEITLRAGGLSMFRRLVAGLLVAFLIAGTSVPVLGQKDKDKKADDKKKEEKKDDKKKDDKPGAAGELKWKLEKDKVFYQTMETKTVQTMKIMGNDVNQTQTQKFYFSWKPTKVEADKATIEQEILGVSMDIEIGGSRISYDSTKDTTANNPLGDFFKALVGSKFTIDLDTKNLKVTKVDGKDAFI